MKFKQGDIIVPINGEPSLPLEVICEDKNYEYSPGKFSLKVKTKQGHIAYLGSRFTNVTPDMYRQV